MLDAITYELSELANRVIAYRLVRLIETGELTMPLEIKGLKGKALKARANIDALNNAYDKFNEAAPKHVADVEGLASQVEGMQSDLDFAANVLGNSTGESEKLAEKPKQEPVVTAPETAPASVASPPPVPSPLPAGSTASTEPRT